MISIIIPVLNEAAIIQESLSLLQNNPEIEVIVVDGGSQDQTVKFAQEMGVKVFSTKEAGRAKQMNLGAKMAQGDIVLFLHGDTRLPPKYAAIIQDLLQQPQVIAGAFSLKISGDKLSLRIVETLVNWRSHFLSLPYGDQAIFIKTSIFHEIGGFPELPIMEDFEFIQRLKLRGKIAITTAAVLTSGRRWQKLGVLRTTFINQMMIFGYYLGVSPEKLQRLYHRK